MLGLTSLNEFKTKALGQYDTLSVDNSIGALVGFLHDMLNNEGKFTQDDIYIMPIPCFITGQMDYNAAVVIDGNIFIFSNSMKQLKSINGYGKINELILV
ncbi:MAG: hypothetical protein K0S71_594 [Clostridia bacterium]|jgi:hypothetical protein|nr:hypothetical protein [Clostridia bacterium]